MIMGVFFFPMRFQLTFVLTVVFGAAWLRAEETWPFHARDDAFTADALLDLRSLNEKQSGEHGWVKLSADGNSFARGDGAPIRFWAVCADGWELQPDEMDRQCRFLAKMGVNLVRLHFVVASKDAGAGNASAPALRTAASIRSSGSNARAGSSSRCVATPIPTRTGVRGSMGSSLRSIRLAAPSPPRGATPTTFSSGSSMHEQFPTRVRRADRGGSGSAREDQRAATASRSTDRRTTA